MTSITKQDVLSDASSHQSGRWYTEDEINNRLIEEFKKFKESLQQHYKSILEKNVEIAKKQCESLAANIINDLNVLTTIHLRCNSINCFDAVVEIPEKVFLSEDFDNVYALSKSISDTANHKEFEIGFHFIPQTKQINTAALYSDGFKLTYSYVKKTSARPA